MGSSERGTRNAERGSNTRSAFGVPRSALEDAPPETLDTRDLIVDPLDAFLHDYHEKSRLDRQILDHLLHSAFADSNGQAEPETDLILDSDPDEATIHAVLGPYPFSHVRSPYPPLSPLP